jgi:hypothetical protein
MMPGCPIDIVKEGNPMMKRSLLLSGLVTLGLFAAGCSQHTTANDVVANAPAGDNHLSGRIPETGTYILFRVNAAGRVTDRPTSVTQVASYDLQEGDRVGFEWVPDEKSANAPDAHMDLIAYAGSARQNLGPIETLEQHYYWATKAGFDHYWKDEPINGFVQRMTLQE